MTHYPTIAHEDGDKRTVKLSERYDEGTSITTATFASDRDVKLSYVTEGHSHAFHLSHDEMNALSQAWLAWRTDQEIQRDAALFEDQRCLHEAYALVERYPMVSLVSEQDDNGTITYFVSCAALDMAGAADNGRLALAHVKRITEEWETVNAVSASCTAALTKAEALLKGHPDISLEKRKHPSGKFYYCILVMGQPAVTNLCDGVSILEAAEATLDAWQAVNQPTASTEQTSQ